MNRKLLIALAGVVAAALAAFRAIARQPYFNPAGGGG